MANRRSNSSPGSPRPAAAQTVVDAARAEGLEPLAYIRSWAVAAVDPAGQLLMGPGLAIPRALERAGLELNADSSLPLPGPAT